jgi:hypothetical protein
MKKEYSLFFYVFRRLFERNDDVSRIDDRLPLSSLIVTRDDFDELIFPNSFNKIGSGLIRIVNLGRVRR